MLRSHRAGFPRVASSAFVDDSAQVIGDVEIGEDSSVWMNVVIRGDVNRIHLAPTASRANDGQTVRQ